MHSDVNCPPALAPFRTVAPAEAVMTVEAAKQHLNVRHGDQDELIEALVNAAVAYCDGWSGILGRCLVTQTWGQFFPDFSADRLEPMRLRLRPVSAVGPITYFDGDGVEQTLSSSLYRLLTDDLSPLVAPTPDAVWPGAQARPDAVKVLYTAGYGAADDVPAAIKLALKQMIAHWFENREAVNIGAMPTEIPLGARALLAPFRSNLIAF